MDAECGDGTTNGNAMEDQSRVLHDVSEWCYPIFGKSKYDALSIVVPFTPRKLETSTYYFFIMVLFLHGNHFY